MHTHTHAHLSVELAKLEERISGQLVVLGQEEGESRGTRVLGLLHHLTTSEGIWLNCGGKREDTVDLVVVVVFFESLYFRCPS